MLHFDLFKKVIGHVRPKHLVFIFCRFCMFDAKLVDQLATV